MKTLVIFFLPAILTVSCTPYKGSPWQNLPQSIPGRVECELFDSGGEGMSYHDSDSINNGSGRLNPANGDFYNEFRMNEGVDISYTKTGGVDDNPFNDIEPEMKKLYVGWTVPGEWIRYTVNVKESGKYIIELMYTCNGNGVVEVMTDDSTATTGFVNINSTYKDADTIAWRQWHHWNKMTFPGTLELKEGVQVIRMKTINNGNMNYDYLEFRRDD